MRRIYVVSIYDGKETTIYGTMAESSYHAEAMMTKYHKKKGGRVIRVSTKEKN